MVIRDIKDKELRELAMLNYKQKTGKEADVYSSVIEFSWTSTPEGHRFWRDVNLGICHACWISCWSHSGSSFMCSSNDVGLESIGWFCVGLGSSMFA